jgi:hypothetical protein
MSSRGSLAKDDGSFGEKLEVEGAVIVTVVIGGLVLGLVRTTESAEAGARSNDSNAHRLQVELE